MTNIEHREPMIRAAREALERHEPPDDDADDDGRALAVVLAMEPLIADQLQGAVEDRDEMAALLTEAVRSDYGTSGWRARAIKAGCLAAIGGQ